MPKRTNDDLIREQREKRATHVKVLSHDAAEAIMKLFQRKRLPTVEEVAAAIEAEFKKLPG
jgi:hypothetical protein